MDLGFSANAWFLRSARVHVPNDISIGSAVIAGLAVVSYRQMDRQRMRGYKIGHNLCHALRCGARVVV